MSCSETSRFEMSSNALVPASTTDTGDIVAVDQGLPIQSLCEVCERILATGPSDGWSEMIRLEGRTTMDFQAAASGGCGICKLVIRSKTYKERKWSKKSPIGARFHKQLSGTVLLRFADKFYDPLRIVTLQLLEPQGITPELFGT